MYCVCMCMYALCSHATSHMWRTGDNVFKLVLSFQLRLCGSDSSHQTYIPFLATETSHHLFFFFPFLFLRQSQIGQTSVKPSRQPKLSFQSSCLQTPDAGMMGVHLYNAGDETQRFVHVSKASYQDKYTPKLCCLSEIFNWTSCILFSSLAVAVIV